MKRPLWLLLAAVGLGLVGCSTTANPPLEPPSHTASTSVAASVPEEESGAANREESGQSPIENDAVSRFASNLAARDLPDPHGLTGISFVEDVPDPQPLEGEYPQTLPVRLTDAEGNEVAVNDTSRVLAIDVYGTLSRTVIALGFGENLVGRTSSSTEAQLAALPVVTENGHQLNAEAVMALAPSLILADRSIGPPEALDQLRASGIPVVLVESERSLPENSQLLRTVAHALGADEAGEALVDRTEREIEEAKATIARWAPERPLDAAFLYVRGTAGIFFIFGTEDGATELIQSVLARDVAGENGITSMIPANAESLVALDPEVIFTMSNGLDSTGGLDGLLQRPGVAQTRAGASSRVVAIPDGVALSFGPQTGDILFNVAKALYGVPQ